MNTPHQPQRSPPISLVRLDPPTSWLPSSVLPRRTCFIGCGASSAVERRRRVWSGSAGCGARRRRAGCERRSRVWSFNGSACDKHIMMTTQPWTLKEAKQHFFIYIEKIGAADLLHELRGSPIVAHVDVNRVALTLHQNLRAAACAASTPFYMSFSGTHNGRTSAIRELLDRAGESLDKGAFQSAYTLLKNNASSVHQSLEPLHMVHSNNIIPEAFQALLRQATAMIWGAFEAYCYDLYRLVFTRKPALLRTVASAFAPGTAWGLHPKKLADHIDAEARKATPVSSEKAFDWYADNRDLPSMSLGAIRFFAKVLFSLNAPLLGLLNGSEVAKIAARRHVLLHAAGVIDQDYLTASGENLSIGASLVVTPRELALGFRAISEAGGALANAAQAVL